MRNRLIIRVSHSVMDQNHDILTALLINLLLWLPSFIAFPKYIIYIRSYMLSTVTMRIIDITLNIRGLKVHL